jgi:hypothetical protein
MKKIGPCKILRKFDANAYEIELPNDVGISPIFIISDMYPYKEDDTERSGEDSVGEADVCSRKTTYGEDH